MKLVFFILLSVISTAAFAAAATEDSQYDTVTYGHISRSQVWDQNREDKTYTLNTAPIGFTAGPGLGVSETISAGLFLNKRNILFIEGSHESASGTNGGWLTLGLAGTTNYQTDMSVWGVGLKHFVNNWLFLKTSANYIVARANSFYSPGIFDTSSATNGSVQGSAIAGAFSIGNEWQWSTFNLGIQWVGALVPVYSNVTRDEIGANAPSFSRDDQNSLKNSLFSSMEFEFARVYVGVAF